MFNQSTCIHGNGTKAFLQHGNGNNLSRGVWCAGQRENCVGHETAFCFIPLVTWLGIKGEASSALVLGRGASVLRSMEHHSLKSGEKTESAGTCCKRIFWT